MSSDNNNNNSKPYGPNERDFFEANETPVKSYSLTDYVNLPNHVIDPIVVNNISNAEFDYTFNEDSDLLDKDDESSNKLK